MRWLQLKVCHELTGYAYINDESSQFGTTLIQIPRKYSHGGFMNVNDILEIPHENTFVMHKAAGIEHSGRAQTMQRRKAQFRQNEHGFTRSNFSVIERLGHS